MLCRVLSELGASAHVAMAWSMFCRASAGHVVLVCRLVLCWLAVSTLLAFSLPLSCCLPPRDLRYDPPRAFGFVSLLNLVLFYFSCSALPLVCAFLCSLLLYLLFFGVRVLLLTLSRFFSCYAGSCSVYLFALVALLSFLVLFLVLLARPLFPLLPLLLPCLSLSLFLPLSFLLFCASGIQS